MISFRLNSLSISLPNPQIGNTTTYNMNFLARRAMDGTLYSYRKGSRVDTLKLSFIAMSRDKIIEMIDFVKQTAGKNIIYRDFSSVDYLGKITNSPFDSTDRGANCMSEFDLEFELTWV